VISATENSNTFPKTRFWKEKSVEDVVTLGHNGTGHTSTVKCKNNLTRIAS
jgi:ABC-type branched-subunit amino acid transport system ATPase component